MEDLAPGSQQKTEQFLPFFCDVAMVVHYDALPLFGEGLFRTSLYLKYEQALVRFYYKNARGPISRWPFVALDRKGLGGLDNWSF